MLRRLQQALHQGDDEAAGNDRGDLTAHVGPRRVHEQEQAGVLLLAHPVDHPAGHGEGGYARRADHGVDLFGGEEVEELGEEDAAGEKKLSFDKLTINLDAYELLVDGKRVDTPPKELELLYHLASSPNRVFTRNQLLDEVWGFDYFGDSRTVDVHIKRLREKLEGVSTAWSLKTVWGVGYKFEVGPA